jgi:hypothetical protein
VRPEHVVFQPPFFNQHLSLLQGIEDLTRRRAKFMVQLQTDVNKRSIESPIDVVRLNRNGISWLFDVKEQKPGKN